MLTTILGIAQQQNLPLNREFSLVNQKLFNGFKNNVHTSFLPINQSFINSISDSTLANSERKFYLINITKEEKKPRNFFGWIYRSAFYKNALIVDSSNFYLTVDPLVNFEIGKDREDASGKTLSKNTRGVIVRGNISGKLSFETSFYENQVVLPGYLDDYANSTEVIPGQGRWKPFKSNQGYDFSSASANLSYTPNKHFNFQLGTGKNFIGDGYRSLLLSDASFNYPFWKIITTFGKNDQFQYTKLNASLSSVTRREVGSTAETLFQRKTMSTHYLSWLTTKWLSLGLFEATLWQTEDSTGTKPLQWQQFNPIIGVNTFTTGFNAVNHSIIGTNLKIKLPFHAILYNQIVYDGNSRAGVQIGAKYFGVTNLTIQAEYNSVANGTYASEVELQAYTNYNEALAHPSGNNFKEILGIINYKYKRVFTQVKYNQIKYKLEVDLLKESTNRRIINLQAHLGYLINTKNNLSILAGINQRTETIYNTINKTNYIFLGIRTSLRNLYTDF